MQTTQRPQTGTGGVISLAGLLVLLAIAAFGGGLSMIADPTGAGLGMEQWADQLPVFDDFLVPGYLLVVLQGVLPLLLAAGLLSRLELPLLAGMERALGYRWPLPGVVLEGVGIIAWIVVQLVTIPVTAPVQLVVLAIGVGLVVLALLPPVKARYRL